MYNLELNNCQHIALGSNRIHDIVDAFGTKYVLFENDENIFELCKLGTPDLSILLHSKGTAFTILSELVYLKYELMLWVAQASQMLYIPHDLSKIVEIPFEVQIVAAKWDSDQHILATFDVNGHVTCYQVNVEEESLFELSNSYATGKVINSAYVGWGSASTQFHGRGKGGKADVAPDVTYKCDDPTVTIEWRGNSEMFVVGCFDGVERKIKVYDKDCTLYFESSTTLPGLCVPLAYKPNSNTIVTVRSTDGHNQKLTFIEKNGEIHMELALKDQIPVKSLKWSTSGSCLAVYHESDNKSYLDLYLSSNSRWIHKQRIPIKNGMRKFEFKNVVETNSYNLTLFYETEQINLIFVKKVCRSHNKEKMTYTIKGCHVDAFIPGYEIVPPGLDVSAYKTEHQAPINTIVVHPNKDTVAIITSDHTVHIYDYTIPTNWQLINSFSLNQYNLVYNYTFESNDLVYTVLTNDGSKVRKKHEINKCDGDDTPVISDSLLTDDSFDVAIIYEYEIVVSEIVYNIQINTLSVLKINNVVIKGKFTSLYIFNDYLLLTAVEDDASCSNKLISMMLVKEFLDDLVRGKDIFKAEFAYSRNIELGGTIITSVPNSSKVVVQFPRGNIECIELRLVTLNLLHEMARTLKYRDAVDHILFESLGLDMLFDVHPTSFLTNLPTVIEQIANPVVLNRLLIGLSDETTLSKSELEHLRVDSEPQKRVKICEGIIKTILKMKSPAPYMSTLALANLCITAENNNITAALESIAKLHNCDRYKDHLEESILALNQYISFENLYECALMIYDIKLAQYIAEKSNMDPKIYKVFLKKLEELDELSRRYEISAFLNNHQRAITYLLYMYRTSLVTKDKLLGYAVDKNCLDVLHKLVDEHDSDLLVEVSKRYAEELVAKSKFLEAGSALYKAQYFEEAFLLYTTGLHWQEAILAVYKTNDAARNQKFRTIALKLKESGMFLEASKVFFEHCLDNEGGLQCLLDGHYYHQAHMLASAQHDTKFIEADLTPSLLSYYGVIDEQIDDLFRTFLQRFARLKEIREEKLLGVGGYTRYHADDDLIDDAESVATTTTRSSSRSSKSSKSLSRKLKKEERKVKDDRKGAKYEDIALMFYLHKVITDTFDLSKSVDELCRVLDVAMVLRGVSHIEHMVTKLSSIQKCMIEASDQIWPAEYASYKSTELVSANVEQLQSKFRTRPEVATTTNIISTHFNGVGKRK